MLPPIFNFRTTGRDAGPLANLVAVDQFSRTLRRADPFGSQQAVSGALADLTTGESIGRDQFRALLALDKHTAKLGDRLLQNYSDDPPKGRSLERRSWQSAFELSRSFAGAYDFVLRHIRDAAPSRGWREYAPDMLFGLLHHRQIEFLLRPFVNASAIADCWPEIHGAFKYAKAQRILHHTGAIRRVHDASAAETTIEREYIHVLLLGLVGDGQFSPYDAFRVNRRMPRWSAVLLLKSDDAQGMAEHGPVHLVVDPDMPEGLTRVDGAMAGSQFYLDPFPMLGLVDDEIAVLRESGTVRSVSSSSRDRQLKLLRKLSTIFAPKPPRITRRGERTPASSTVQAIVGFAQIARMLRHERRRKSVSAPIAVPYIEEITITVDGGYTEYSSTVMGRKDNPRLAALNGEFGVPHQVWHLQDRSGSGCRFRGQIGESGRLFPGALAAIREGENAPWTLVVVRVLRPRVGEGADIGVEFVGRDPQAVVLTIDERYAEGSHEPTDSKRLSFPGLQLPPCAKHPAMPFKTIVLAPREFRVGRCLSLQSPDATRTIRLKEAIEEQDDFIWLPYEAADRHAGEQPAQQQSAEGMSTAAPATRLEASSLPRAR